MSIVIFMLLLLAPCAALTTAWTLMWRRRHTVATVVTALGFAATSLSLLLALFAPIKTHAVLVDVNTALPTQDTYLFMPHYHWFSVPALGALGMWVAAAGMLWHVRGRLC